MDIENFKDGIRSQVIALMDKHGLQAKLARKIGKNPSFFAELKRGKPVNALHLKAIGEMFGPQVVCELLGMSMDDDASIGQFGENLETDQLLAMASTVLESDFEMSRALATTIRGLFTAVENNKQMASIREQLSGTQQELERTKAEVKTIRTELDSIRQENKSLKSASGSAPHHCCQKDRRQRQEPVKVERRTGPADRRRAVNE